MDAGVEPIANAAELGQVRRQARLVHLRSVLAAAVLTTVFALL